MSTTELSTDPPAWYAKDAGEALGALAVDPDQGLTIADAQQRLAEYGPNQLATEPPPSMWSVALGQLSNPMNIMLAIVAVASLAIGQVATGIFVALLVTFNVVMGSRQELKARASVDALSQLQVPHARVRRAGRVDEVASVDLVPGDVVLLEAGDVVPADGRILSSATLEVQEAALTGESAPVAKDATTLPEGDVALGDRTNIVFQNTQVTRGTASFVVTATGQATQMGRIADMVAATERVRSPLQRELDGMTKIFGLLAWTAVAIIAIVGIARDQDTETLILLCISTAISAIPVGLPTFVQTMLSSGARHLAESKAVVKSLTDVETLGGTTVINSDKTGTLTMNAMTATSMLADGQWFSIEGGGYVKTGAILGVGGGPVPDFSRLALGLVLSCDATVGDDGSVIGDPTEAAFVVLAAKMGVGAEETRAALPRRAEVPFDSEYKFMATFHDRPDSLSGGVLHESHFMTVKGGPDVVIDRCGLALWHGEQVPIGDVRDELLAANQKLSEQGLRVLAFAVRDLDDAAMSTATVEPMAAVTDLLLVALVGIIDPLRAEAKDAVRIALDAGIDVRMITGDHTVTARAIADQLGLGPGLITGTDLQRLSDADVIERLPQLHVFGRVAPEDKVRLARLMQEAGEVVAMTGDAVNDAAALKQADIGVAMGSGSEVTKQAGKIVLTDDNFATLVARGRPRPRHLPTHHVLREVAVDRVVLGPAAHGPGDDLRHQRGRGAVPDAVVVLQVLRRRHRRHRVRRRRSRSQRHAASAAHTRHADRDPAPGDPLGDQRLHRRRHRARGLALGSRHAEHDPTVGLDDHGVRDRGAQRGEPRGRAATRTASRHGRRPCSRTSAGSSSGGSSRGLPSS